MDFDLSKENIQPLRGGRNATQLGAALQAQNDSEYQKELLQQKEEFENMIKNYKGNDPLENWYNYISWIEQSYPKHGHEGNLTALLEDCLGKFEYDQRYLQDRRLCKLFIKYFDLQHNPLELFQLLYSRGFGTNCTDFYRAWAYYYEANGDFKRADQIFQLGFQASAQPHEELKIAYDNFTMAVGRHVLRGSADTSHLAEKRRALTSLRTYKHKHRTIVPSQRTGVNVVDYLPGTVKSVNEPSRPSNYRVDVFQDSGEEGIAGPSQSTASSAKPKSILDSASKQVAHKENMLKAGPWNNAFAKKSGVHSSNLNFTVHVDDAEKQESNSISTPLIQQPPSTPMINHFADLEVELFIPEPNNNTKISQYNINEVYANNNEYSFEELNTRKYFECKKLIEQQVKQEQQQIYQQDYSTNYDNNYRNDNSGGNGEQQQTTTPLKLRLSVLKVSSPIIESTNDQQQNISEVINENGITERRKSISSNLIDAFNNSHEKQNNLPLNTPEEVAKAVESISSSTKLWNNTPETQSNVPIRNDSITTHTKEAMYEVNNLWADTNQYSYHQDYQKQGFQIHEDVDDNQQIHQQNYLMQNEHQQHHVHQQQQQSQQPSFEIYSDNYDYQNQQTSHVAQQHQMHTNQHHLMSPNQHHQSSHQMPQQSPHQMPQQSPHQMHQQNHHQIHQQNQHQIHQQSLHQQNQHQIHQQSLHQQNQHQIHQQNQHQLHQQNQHQMYQQSSHQIHQQSPHQMHQQNHQMHQQNQHQIHNHHLQTNQVQHNQQHHFNNQIQQQHHYNNQYSQQQTTNQHHRLVNNFDETVSTQMFNFNIQNTNMSTPYNERKMQHQLYQQQQQQQQQQHYPSPLGIGGAGHYNVHQKMLSPNVDHNNYQNVSPMQHHYSSIAPTSVATSMNHSNARQELFPQYSKVNVTPIPQQNIMATQQEPQHQHHHQQQPPASTSSSVVTTYQNYIHNQQYNIMSNEQQQQKINDESINEKTDNKLSTILETSKEYRSCSSAGGGQSSSSGSSSGLTLKNTLATTPESLPAIKEMSHIGASRDTCVDITNNKCKSKSLGMEYEVGEAMLQLSQEIYLNDEQKDEPPDYVINSNQNNYLRGSVDIYVDQNSKHSTDSYNSPPKDDNQEDIMEWDEHSTNSMDYAIGCQNLSAILASDKPVNPFDSKVIDCLLKKARFPNIRHTTGYIKVQQIPKISPKETVFLKNDKYLIDKVLGKGTFGTVFKGNNLTDGGIVAIKYQKPSNFWEFYICKEIQHRIKDSMLLLSFMDITKCYYCKSSSLFISEFSKYGSLLNVANKVKKVTGKQCKEVVTYHFVAEMIRIVAALHQCQIIHADIKPDNFLVMCLPPDSGGRLSLQLIDFGCSIDMTLFPSDMCFYQVVTTEDFTCTEMREGKPWTYQTDLYCIAASAHVLLMNDYMKVKKEDGDWTVVKRFPRYVNLEIWKPFFRQLLNIESCDNLPDLTQMQAHFQSILNERHSDLTYELRQIANIMNDR